MRLPEACSVVPWSIHQSPGLTSLLPASGPFRRLLSSSRPVIQVSSQSHLHKSASCSAFKATNARGWRRGGRDWGGSPSRGRSGLAGHQYHRGEGTGGQRDPGRDRGTIPGAATLLHTRPQPRNEAIPLCDRAWVRSPGPAPPRAVPCLRSWPAGWGWRARSTWLGVRGAPPPPGTGGPRGVRAAGPAAGVARAGGRGQGARGGAAGRGSAGEMCERAARLCRVGAHRLLREPPPQGRALGGLLRWVGARMGEPRAPLVPDIPAADPDPGPAAPRGGTAVILDVSTRGTLRRARLGACPHPGPKDPLHYPLSARSHIPASYLWLRPSLARAPPQHNPQLSLPLRLLSPSPDRTVLSIPASTLCHLHIP